MFNSYVQLPEGKGYLRPEKISHLWINNDKHAGSLVRWFCSGRR